MSVYCLTNEYPVQHQLYCFYTQYKNNEYVIFILQIKALSFFAKKKNTLAKSYEAIQADKNLQRLQDSITATTVCNRK